MGRKDSDCHRALLQELGQRVSDAVNSKAGEALADRCVGGSWMCGACDYLAIAIGEWLGDVAEPIALVRGSRFEHAVVRIGTCFLDADGLSTKDELLNRWKRVNSEGTPLTMEPLVPNCPKKEVMKVVRFLKSSVGSGNGIAMAIKNI